MEDLKAEVKQTVTEVKERYAQVEGHSDNLLQKLKDSPFTALILGAILGGAGVFFTIAC